MLKIVILLHIKIYGLPFCHNVRELQAFKNGQFFSTLYPSVKKLNVCINKEHFTDACQIGTLDVLVGLLDEFSELDPYIER